MSDTFGNSFSFTSIGGSHDPEMKGIVIGLPSGIKIDFKEVLGALKRRSPASYPGTTPRHETDEVKWLSGIENNLTTGDPIEFIIKNKNYLSRDYDELKGVFRPSHADYTYYKKYGDKASAGMGRASGRETVLRVVAGSLAAQYLQTSGIGIISYVRNIGGIEIDETDFDFFARSCINCPDKHAEKKILQLIDKTTKEGDTLGGIIECVIKDFPAGIGDPIFNKLHVKLANAVLSIPSVKGFDIGRDSHHLP